MSSTSTINHTDQRTFGAMKHDQVWSDEMLFKLLGRIRAGENRDQLAAEYGETPYRILKLRDQAMRLEARRAAAGPLTQLGGYARNSLLAAGLSTPEQVKAAIDNGSLGRVALLGAQRINEIKTWLESKGIAA